MAEKEIFIKSRSDNKIYSVDKGNLTLSAGDLVVFEFSQCQEIAKVISADELKEERKNNAEVEKETGENRAVVIRRLSPKDIEQDDQKKAEAREKLGKCREIVSKHSLPMELLDADLSFDGKKLTFYFTAPGRVDFRSLVSELASTFQKLIRLQQVGVRDRARCVGGTGRCGQQFCCKRFLKGELDGVTIDMAYEQNLAQMGSNRVTGACGKLMCCLKYELEFYKKGKAKMPALGSEIKTAKGKGAVIEQNVIKNTVTVQLPDRIRVEVDCP